MKNTPVITTAVHDYDPVSMCACGQPLHYKDPEEAASMDQIVREAGDAFTTMSVESKDGTKRSFRVQRHYVALHGVKGSQLASLGFEEVAE